MEAGATVSDESPMTPGRTPSEQIGPYSQLIADARARLQLSERRLAALVTESAWDLNKETTTVHGSAVSRWESGTIARRRMRRWIAHAFQRKGLDISAADLDAAAEAQKRTRYRLHPRLASAQAIVVATHDPMASTESPGIYSRIDGADNEQQEDWPAWFGYRLAHLVSVVDKWQGELFDADGLQSLLHQEILMFDVLEPTDPNEAFSFTLSRRQALVALAALPLALTTSSAGSFGAAVATESFLGRCGASLAACWHLLKGADLTAVDQMLSAYLVPLAAIAQNTSPHQRTAARLASQAHRICGIVALHRHELRVRERHCQQAVYFAGIAADPSVEVSALVSLASTHFYANDPRRAASVYERALSHDSTIPPLQRSRVHAELAVVYGQMQREQDSLRSLRAAEELYPEQPEQDRSFLYAEFTPASMALEQGLAYLALAEHYPAAGYQRKALDVFEQVERTMARAMPDRIRAEITNQQAAASVLLGDLDLFETHFINGIGGARRLRSRQRQHESLAVWRMAHQRWPTERRLKAFGERIQLSIAHDRP